MLEEKGRITEADVRAFPKAPTRNVLMGGRNVCYEVDRTTYRTENGELRLLTYSRDVSDRIKHEEEIRNSELRLNRAERIGRSGSWEYLPETEELFWSDHHARLHGLEPEPGPVDLAKIRRFIDADDIPALSDRFEKLDADHPVLELRYGITRASDGARRQLQAVGEIETDAKGNIVRVTGATRDITEQQELEDRLREGREHLDALVGSNLIGVFYSDLEDRILEANDAFLELIGYRQADLPLSWIDLTPVDLRARDEIARSEFRETGRTRPFEKEFISRDGERIPMLVGCAQIRPGLSLVMAIDQSERKRVAFYIERQQQKLEETIAERTRELPASRSRLVEAERLAAVGTLAAGVGGTGLGLSVAHGVVKDHAGEIRVESVQGEGTRVVVSLPIVDAEAPKAAEDDVPMPRKASSGPD